MKSDTIQETETGYRYLRLTSGKIVDFWEALRQARKANSTFHTWMSRCFKLVSTDAETRADDLERLEWFIDDLEHWLLAIRSKIDKQRGNLTKQDRIARLRNVTGRTPEEAELFRAKADQLERGLDAEG